MALTALTPYLPTTPDSGTSEVTKALIETKGSDRGFRNTVIFINSAKKKKTVGVPSTQIMSVSAARVVDDVLGADDGSDGEEGTAASIALEEQWIQKRNERKELARRQGQKGDPNHKDSSSISFAANGVIAAQGLSRTLNRASKKRAQETLDASAADSESDSDSSDDEESGGRTSAIKPKRHSKRMRDEGKDHRSQRRGKEVKRQKVKSTRIPTSTTSPTTKGLTPQQQAPNQQNKKMEKKERKSLESKTAGKEWANEQFLGRRKKKKRPKKRSRQKNRKKDTRNEADKPGGVRYRRKHGFGGKGGGGGGRGKKERREGGGGAAAAGSHKICA